ncbi:uncharacterized protein C7orf57-like isoform X1 [Amblyraja radiata]|uniref:uncharacterized protein C7orf57-like isoform X1 n=1 Tax=Amblyraja radiata TaxID=386614 RepID=UPI001403AFD1|nr:uncharacterized protein C7orf57-like isoform X1 [Amblyraja radiata]
MSSSSQFSDCDWFYHVPQKPNKSEKSQVQLPPTSQIPGLNELVEPHKEASVDGRKLWIRETDSDYVKLAKQGGRPDLLRHYSPPPRKSSPVSFLQPEWFTHAAPPAKNKEVTKWYLPEYMVHEEFIPSPSNNKSKKIFHDSDKTTLEKESEDNEKENEEKVKLKLPEITDKRQRGKLFTRKTIESENKFPTMSLPGKNEPINFTKLMTNGYADDWIQQQKEWKKNMPPQIKEHADLIPHNQFQEEFGKKELPRNAKPRGRKSFSTKMGQKVSFRDPGNDPMAKTSLILNKFKDMPA